MNGGEADGKLRTHSHDACFDLCRHENYTKDMEGMSSTSDVDILVAHLDGTSVHDIESILHKIKKPCQIHLCGGVDDRKGEGKRICRTIFQAIADCNKDCTETSKLIEIVSEFVGRANTTEHGGAKVGGLAIDSKTLEVIQWERTIDTLIPFRELRSARMYCSEYSWGRRTKKSIIDNCDCDDDQRGDFLFLYSVLNYDGGRREFCLDFKPFRLTALFDDQLCAYIKFCLQLLKEEGKAAFLLQTSTTPFGEPSFFVEEQKETFEYILALNQSSNADTLPFEKRGNQRIQCFYNQKEHQWLMI